MNPYFMLLLLGTVSLGVTADDSDFNPEENDDNEDCDDIFCEEEEFIHDYILLNGERKENKNKWTQTDDGEKGTLQALCLLPNGLPVMRKCYLEDGKARWESLTNWTRISCVKEPSQNIVSPKLKHLHDDILSGKQTMDNVAGRHAVSTNMTSIIRQKDIQVIPADVSYAGQIFTALKDHGSDEAVGPDLVSTCERIMAIDQTVLRLSAEINATNSLVETFEEYMDEIPQKSESLKGCGQSWATNTSEIARNNEVEKMNYSLLGVQGELTRNLSVFFVNPRCSKVSGIAIYSEAASERIHSNSGFWYRFLYMTESVNDIKKENNLEVAAFFDEQLWQAISKAGAEFIVFKIYAHDGLFVETSLERSRRPRSKVLSITTPGFNGTLPHALSFLLRNENYQEPGMNATELNTSCAYWTYKSWESEGMKGGDNIHEPVILCETQHLTQFAFLVGGQFPYTDLSNKILLTPLILDIITLVGCLLSLFGLLGIWLTAAFFKSWRRQASTKVLLNLCLALTLQMILFVFVNTDDLTNKLINSRSYERCIALGAFLQYAILVVFTWMLIIAFLQYQRYVKVIGVQRPKHYILKAAIVAWSLPLLPILLLLLYNPYTYIPATQQSGAETGICYPAGHGLIYGVLLPITIITMVNFGIFVSVFYSVHKTLSQSSQRAKRIKIRKKISLSVMLFFLLGLSWIFGIFAYMRYGLVFSYLFCATATTQGFVLFLYFVVLDKSNRRSWIALFCPSKKKNMHKNFNFELTGTLSTKFSSRSQL